MKTLKIAVRKFGPFENAVRKVWDEFNRKTGRNLSLEMVPLELHNLYKSTISDNGLKKGEWDLAVINTDWIYEAYTTSGVQNLQPYLEKDPPQDFPSGWSPSLLSLQEFNNSAFGLPFHDGPECLIYRQDLFEDPAEKNTYYKKFGKELHPPNTWEEFQQIAEFFQRSEDNLYGTVFAGFPDGHNTVFDFCLQLWTRGGSLFNDKKEISINTQAGREGLEFYRQILRNSKAIHPESPNLDSVKSGEAFAKGEVAMMVNWFGFASVCEVSETSKVKGKVDISTIPFVPGHSPASLNVYYLYVMGAGSRKKELAWEFMKYAVNAKNDKLLTLEGGIGCRTSTWKDPEVNRVIPYYHKLELLHQHARALPQKSNWSQIASQIDKMVLEAVNTDKPVEEILQYGQDKIAGLNKVKQ